MTPNCALTGSYGSPVKSVSYPTDNAASLYDNTACVRYAEKAYFPMKLSSSITSSLGKAAAPTPSTTKYWFTTCATNRSLTDNIVKEFSVVSNLLELCALKGARTVLRGLRHEVAYMFVAHRGI